MKYHFLHDFGISTPPEEKCSDHFKDLHKLKLLINFDVNLTSSAGRVTYKVLNVQFVTYPSNEVKLT